MFKHNIDELSSFKLKMICRVEGQFEVAGVLNTQFKDLLKGRCKNSSLHNDKYFLIFMGDWPTIIGVDLVPCQFYF